jgi:hypothetical protein
VLIPITVLRCFAYQTIPVHNTAGAGAEMPAITNMVKTILESRHRAGAKYRVDNLAAILVRHGVSLLCAASGANAGFSACFRSSPVSG